MKRIFTHLFVAVLLMVGMPSWAQLTEFEDGAVYRFVNRSTGRALNAGEIGDGTLYVNATTAAADDLKQQWYVTKEGNYYVLRNLYYAKYLKGAITNKVPWSLTDYESESSNHFSLVASDVNYNTLETKDWTNYGHMHDDGNGYNGGYRVVSWDNSSSSSHWTIHKVEYAAEALKEVLEAHPTTEEVLNKRTANFVSLFNDGACCTPKYSSLAAAQGTEAYQALTDDLKQLVDKIYNKTYGSSGWAEDNADSGKDGWDSEYAKKFRVQMYEPYSIAKTGSAGITSWLGINWHANNDNPTGIYVHEAGTVYVMVEGEIAEGATLRIVDAGSNDRLLNATTGGTSLQSGLNIINFTQAGGMLYICYNVETYNPDGTDDATRFPHKLSDYAPLKIHIEGGAINGFYNACGDFLAKNGSEDLWKTITGASVDEDADWEYMETRANLSVLPILAHRQILLFQLDDVDNDKGMKTMLPDMLTELPALPYNRTKDWADYGMGCDPSTGKINIMVEAWDRIMYSELATMGLLSKSDMARMNDFYPRWNADGTEYSEIYDYSGASSVDGKTLEEFCGVDYSEVFNHHGVALGTTSGYMYGSGDHCGYHINTFGGIVLDIAKTAGSTWGPGHEIGHQHQGLLTLNGLMEVTNNLFANVALWYKGMSTSRYNGNEGSLEQVLKAFNTDGGDTYTNNIWALTHMYYRLWLYYHLAGNNTQFYPRLFELLRHNPMSREYHQDGDVSMLHFYKLACQAAGEDLTEFFRAHGYFSVMEDRLVGDYSNSIYNVSQAMIDEAIAEVKAMRDINGNPLKENLSIIFINDDDDDETANYVQHDGQTKRVIYGETTPNSDFGSVSDFIAGNEATKPYTATLNSDGTITMSGGEGGVGFLILNEKGEIVAFSNKSTFALGKEAELALISGNATVVSISSDNNVAPVEAVADYVVMKKEVLGYLIADVEAVIAEVDDTYKTVGCYKPAAVVDLQTLLDKAQEVYDNSETTAYEGIYEMLYTEYQNVVNNPNSLIGIISGKKYAIKNRGGNDYMTVSGTNVVTTNNSTLPSTDTNLWIIETSGESYHIKHAGTQKYLQGVRDDNSVSFTVGDNAVDYKMTRIENAYHALSTVEHSGRYMNRHSESNVATWNGVDNNSQWAITLVEEVNNAGDIANLELLVSKTRTLLDKIADVDYTGDAYPLQADYSSMDFYITSNATEGGHETNYLLDNDISTFFHTVWAGGSPGEAHYLQIDMGEENKIDQFVFSYFTIGQTNVDAPEVIEITGSDSPNSDFQTITTLTSLPTTHLTPYTSDVLGSAGTKYRYLRFTVTDATGGKLDEYYYFGISELAIKRINYKFNNLRNGYESVAESVVTTAVAQYEAAKNAMANGSGYATALTSLQTAYDNLVKESKEILENKLQSLKTVTDETAALIAQVGSVTKPMSGALALQANEASEAYYISTNADQNTGGGKVDGGGIAALVDNKEETHFHSRWGGTPVNEPHYIQVDLGTEVNANFQFSYVAHNSPDATTIVVSSSKDGDAFTDIETVTKSLTAVGAKYVSKVFEPQDSYRYLRFAVTSSNGRSFGNKFGDYYCFGMKEFDLELLSDLTLTVNNDYSKVVSQELFESTYFTTATSEYMYESATESTDGSLLLTIEMLDAQILDQQAAKTALEQAMAKLTVNKDALQSLYEDALALYNAMADNEGNVNSNYAPSALTPEMLATAKSAIDAAKDVLDNSNLQREIDAAEDALDEQYNALLGIEDANLNENERTELKSVIESATEFLATIATENEGEYTLNSYYENVAGLGFNELCSALQQARNLYNRFYLTEKQCDDVKDILTGCQSATQAVVNADITGRGDLTTLIGNANTLLNDIAAKGEEYYSTANLSLDNLRSALDNAEQEVSGYLTAERYGDLLTQLQGAYDTTNIVVALDCNSENRNNLSTLIGNVNTLLANIANAGETTVALPLQAATEGEVFYISLSAVGDGNVANLIDKNADGSSNINTYVGSAWGGTIADYTHYVQVDLGADCSLDKFSFDYATRNSGHDTERPVKIKILGSNNGTDFTEVTVIEEGLAEGAGEKSALLSVELGKHYRYIRFAVKSGINSFHMSDFNLYTTLSHTLKEYYTTAEGLDFITLCLALDEASDAAAHYMTTEQCATVYNKLNGCYTTADGVVDNDYKGDRDAFATLRADAATLVNGVVVIDETETKIALQCTDANAPYYIYCNAPGATNNYSGDNLGVAALLDVDDNDEPITATFLHTTYTGNSHDDDLDHYLRVDMGESNLLSFKFRYTPRIGNTDNAPLVMLIEGSNDCENFEEITTLTDMATTYQSGEITNGKAYRYIRFMVKDTHNHSAHNGHKFFAMSHFEMTACKTVTISQEYASPNLPVDVAANAYNELVDANALDTEHYLANEVGTTAQAELQAAYDALNAAIALKNIPVKLTTDENNPVLYKIKINRNGDKRLQYDAASAMVAVADEYVGNKAQAWFFMSGADATKDVLILPYTGEGKVLATNSFSEGDSKVKVVESTADGYSNNWNIVAIEDSEWSNITILNGSDATFYFSNHGGDSKKMGFYNTTPSTDGGSMFQFVLDETDYSLSDAYYALYNQYVACGGEVTYGTIIGTYSEVTGTEYNTAYNNAAALLEAKNSTDAEYDNARTTLAEAYAALEYNGGLCRIKSAFTGGYSENKLVYVDAENNPYFEQATDEYLSKYVWEFVPVKGGYNLKSLHTQSYVTAAGWGDQVVLGDEAGAKLVTVDFLDKENGIVRLNVAGGYPLHAQASGSKLVGYTGGLATASAWYVEKVENVEENIKYTVSLGANESGSDTNAYSTLYLAYNAQIPDGVTASIVTGINEIGQLVLTEVEGGILPANTAVVLSCETTDAQNVAAKFLYTDEESAFGTTGNMLQGTSYNKLVHCGNNYNVYMLGKKSGRVAFYWTYENRGADGNYVYINANEEIVESTAAGAHKNHNKGGYVKCNANKAYLLDEENQSQAAAAMYGFLFGGTAGVDSVNAEAVEDTVYDLQGRKLVKVVSPGIYIVNGKKVYVTEIED